MPALRVVVLAVLVASAGCDGGHGPAQAAPGVATAPPNDRIAARSREITSPDNATMVLLYLDLAGLKPALDEWTEQDARVQFAPPADKAARRASVHAELAAAFAAVHDIGRVRISLADAQLSDYDPSYGEFTVRALSPASELVFQAFGQKVTTRFANAQTAQLWRVPATDAQAVRDKVAGRVVSLDALLKIDGVQPGPAGGAIVTRIEQYALHASDGSTLARVP